MPIFEFQCKKCGYIFEEVEFKDLKKIYTQCPNCKKGIAKKIISKSNFIINGYSYSNGYSKEKK